MLEVRKFSALLKSIPIDLETAPETVTRFYLKEMTGDLSGNYNNAQMALVERDKSGEVVGLKDYRKAYTLVLSYSLYDADGKPVPEDVLKTWPSTLLKALAELAVELNGLKPVEGEDPAKKD